MCLLNELSLLHTILAFFSNFFLKNQKFQKISRHTRDSRMEEGHSKFSRFQVDFETLRKIHAIYQVVKTSH